MAQSYDHLSENIHMFNVQILVFPSFSGLEAFCRHLRGKNGILRQEARPGSYSEVCTSSSDVKTPKLVFLCLLARWVIL